MRICDHVAWCSSRWVWRVGVAVRGEAVVMGEGVRGGGWQCCERVAV